MRSNWDHNSPFDCLIKQIEDGQNYAKDGGQPYTTKQLLCNCHVGYMYQTIHDILHHLFKNYRNITLLEFGDNDTKMRSNWDHNSPFDCLIKQIEDGQNYAEDGGQPYTTKQLLCIAYTLIFKTRLYFEEYKQWNNGPATEKTWANFQTQFHNAPCLLHNQLHTTKQAGFHSNYMPIICPTPKPNPLLNT